MSEKKFTKYTPLLIFLLCMLTRVIYKCISYANNFELFPDAYRYDKLSNLLLNGIWEMDVNAYIVAPFYPIFLSLFKLIGGASWEVWTITAQFSLVSISAVWIYQITLLITQSRQTSTLSALIYIFYPLTLWYNFTLVQETLFQSLFIGTIYHLYKSYKLNSDRSFSFAIILLGVSLLTKSHIIVAFPFIVFWIYKYKSLQHLIWGAFGLLLLCLPTAYLNFKNHKIISLSSSGSATLFLLGHSDKTFNCLIKTAGEIESRHAQGCDPDFVFERDYSEEPWSTINKLEPKARFHSRRQAALNWIKDNPGKFIQLKIHGLKRFFIPGLDWKQYKPIIWIFSLILGLAIYIPAIIILLDKKSPLDPAYKSLSWILIITVFLIFMIFFPINRFRIITMEPTLIVLAGIFYSKYIKKWLRKTHSTTIY